MNVPAASTSVVALAFADEIVGDSTLLAQYARAVTAADPVTLVVYAPDTDPAELELRLAPLATEVGLDGDDSAEVVGLAVPGDDATRESLLEQVDCLVTARPVPATFRHLRVVRPHDLGSLAEPAVAVDGFTCNVCGARAAVPHDELDREVPSCASCRSTPRFRAVVHALSLGLFGESLPLGDFPHRPELTGVGLSDWPGYAEPLAARLGYRNTYLHAEPKLDILAPDRGLEGTLDFVISSEVFEHVPPPVSRAFESCARLLKPGGLLVLTVPFLDGSATQEHFPELHDWSLVERDGQVVLVNTTRDGRCEEHHDLRFHGGDGLTLEMRLFGLETLLRDLHDAGFVEITVLREPEPQWGICQSPVGSWPIIARTGSTAPPPDAASARMKRDWDARARENSSHYVASARDDWDEDSYSASGKRDVIETLGYELDRLCRERDPKALALLEVGCGTGRMTEHLASLFGRVEAVDVSAEMIERARARVHAPNASFYETNGTDVSCLPDQSIDLALSFIVFQHVPDRDAIVSTLGDAFRVLRPGAFLKFQVQGSREPAYLDAEKDTWFGVSFDQHELDGIAAKIGFEVVEAEGAGDQYFWQWWRKPEAVPGDTPA